MADTMMLEYDDVTWERDEHGNKVIIGRGASSNVYAGVLHGQPVAIKAEELEDSEVEAWLESARLHVRATCPHIVAAHGVIVEREGASVTHYLVMERLAGTMAELLLTLGFKHDYYRYYFAGMELRLQLLAQVAGGLAYTHAASIIHGDVKPDNVLLTAPSRRTGTPLPVAKLADFGRSGQRRVGTRTRGTGTLAGERGTMVYMDPALLEGSASITAASDVYSFGIMAWQVLTGLHPYEAEMIATLAPTATVAHKVEALRRHVLGGGRPSVATLVERDVPVAVVALVESCWAPGPASRPTMAEVHRALESASSAPMTDRLDMPPPVPALPPRYLDYLEAREAGTLPPAPVAALYPEPALSPSLAVTTVLDPARRGGGGGSSDNSGSTNGGMTLNNDDLVWDTGRGRSPVIIGRGSFGTVYAGRLQGEPVAIKAEVLRAGEEEAWMKAARLHMSATSPHIVAVRGTLVDHDGDVVTHYLVMERLAGTMTARLLEPGGAHYYSGLALRLRLLADVAGGLAYLHSCSVIHADVKPENVLLSASTQPVAKLSDFGSSVLRREGTRTRDTLMGERGSLVYMDPRLFDAAASITAASDVYSFGVMAWQVLSGCVPYAAEMMTTMPATATGPQMVEALRRHVLAGIRPALSALVERSVPQEVVALVEACWAPSQAARPTMTAVHRTLEVAVAATGGVAGDSGGGGGRTGRPFAASVPLQVPSLPVELPAAAAAAASLPTAAPAAALVAAPAVTPAAVALATGAVAPGAPAGSVPLVYE